MKSQRRSLCPTRLALAALLGLAAVSVPAASSKLMNREKMLLVEGQPRFILGLYENPTNDAVLKEAVDAGFNLIQCSPTTEALTRVQQAGAKAWVNLGGNLDVNADPATHPARLKETVERLAAHPALLVWEGPDEILWNHWYGTMEQLRPELETMRQKAAGQSALEDLARQAREAYDRGLYADFERARAEFWRRLGQPSPHPNARLDDVVTRLQRSGEGITAGIQHVRALDPRHVIWLNHAPRNSLADLQLYNRAADMVGCDIYPAPANLQNGHSDLANQGLTSVGAYTRRMQEAAPGKACAMVLQGFGWRDLRKDEEIKPHEKAVGIGRRPSFGESRFMAYDAILHGANAILYWGTAYMKPVEDDGTPVTGRPRLWRDLLRVARELRALEAALIAPALTAPKVRLNPTYGSIDGAGVLCTLRRVEDDFVLIVVNETGDGLGFTLESLPAKLNGRTLHRLHSTEEQIVAGRRLSDGIKPRDVHVYATSRRFEAPTANQ